ncbi:hypothetical protein TNCV_3109761 [Trichonephila clavipes]|nr:hypothetical protein TNCV_3109761 [Trichonephila clavipes]
MRGRSEPAPVNRLVIPLFGVPEETLLFAALSTEVRPSVFFPESAVTTSNSQPTDTSKIPMSVQKNSKVEENLQKSK